MVRFGTPGKGDLLLTKKCTPEIRWIRVIGIPQFLLTPNDILKSSSLIWLNTAISISSF